MMFPVSDSNTSVNTFIEILPTPKKETSSTNKKLSLNSRVLEMKKQLFSQNYSAPKRRTTRIFQHSKSAQHHVQDQMHAKS